MMTEGMELVRRGASSEQQHQEREPSTTATTTSGPSVPIRELPEPLSVKRTLNLSRPPAFAFLDKWSTNTSHFVKNKSCSFFEGLSPWISQIEDVEAKFGTGTGSYFRSLHRLFGLNILVSILCSSLILGPQLAYDVINGKGPLSSFRPLDILSGGGWLSETFMFYGHYDSSISFMGSIFGSAYVYYYSMLAVYFLSILFTSITMAQLYRKNFIDYAIALESQYPFTNKVMCGWRSDTNNQSDSRLLKYKTMNILKESLEGKSSNSPGWGNLKKRVIAKRILVNCIVIGLLVFAGAQTSLTIDIIRNSSISGSDLESILLSFGITLALYVLPLIFYYLGKMEDYELPRTEMYFGLIRSVALEKIFAITIFVKNIETYFDADSCWEDFIGRAIYQLVMAYVLFLLLGTLIMELMHRLLHACFKNIPPPEFDMSRNSMHLIYSQSIALVGYYFVPGLSLIMLFITVLTFYVKLLSLNLTCNKSRAPWRASKSQTVFMVYTFISTLIAVIGYLYVIIRLQPSNVCGPYREFEHTYEIMGEDSFFRDFFLFKQAFILGIITILLVGIYYSQSLNKTYVSETKKLKDDISRVKIEQKILKQLLSSM